MRNGEGTYHRKHASNQPCMRENKKQFGEAFENKYKELQVQLDNGIELGDFDG